jgi:isopentenyl-diphosphate delta-isomerase
MMTDMGKPDDGDSAVSKRKDHHIDVCLDEDVGSGGVATGLGGFALEYDAVPELSLEDVDLRTTLFDKELAAPIVIGAMTGGTARAGEINRRLAQAAARVGVGMALGSQRAMLAKPELEESFLVRDAAPDLPLLFANVGAVQLNYGVTAGDVEQLVSKVGADALNFHLNPLQEAIQPEGDTRFAGLLDKMRACIDTLDVPVLAKEVGAGIGSRAANKLAQLPLSGIEAAGVGGTSWAKVESFRAPADSVQATVGRRLAGFGIPTSQAIRNCRQAFGPDRVVIGSGGVRHGMDIAVAIALGADAGALARPLLEAATESVEAAIHVLETLVYELRVICFCTGVRTPSSLRHVPLIAPGGAWPTP